MTRPAPLTKREYPRILTALMVAGGHLQRPEILVKNQVKSTTVKRNTSCGRACEASCASRCGAGQGLQTTVSEGHENTALAEWHIASALGMFKEQREWPDPSVIYLQPSHWGGRLFPELLRTQAGCCWGLRTGSEVPCSWEPDRHNKCIWVNV